MDFRVLGPLEVADAGAALDLGRPKQRALLGLLLLRSGRAVPVDRLIEELWRGRPPAQAVASLQAYVSNLRRVLERGRAAGEPPRVLVRGPGSYVLYVDPSDLDAGRFESGVARARGAAGAGDHATAHRLFTDALAEWRGEPLADLVDELEPIPELGRLAELRLVALEDLFESALSLGRHTEVVADLDALVREHPLRERLRRHLAVALYRVGRQADALDRLRAGRRLLSDELGLEPSPDSRELEQRILRHAPEVQWTGRTTTAQAPAARSGSASQGLVGRTRELEILAGSWTEATNGRGQVVLVSGDPGIGKTRLAEELAWHAAATGGVARWGRSFEAGGAPAFWPWIQILEEIVQDADDERLCRALGARAAELGRLVPAFSERGGVQPPPIGDAEEARFRLCDAVTRCLLRLAAERPLAVVLEDVHWADASSLELLRFAGAHVRGAPLLLVATYRDSPADRGPALTSALAGLAREAPLVRIALAGLSLGDVSSLLAQQLAAPPPDELARALHERTDGNAFYLSEVVRLVQASQGGGPPAWDVVPVGVREVIERRVDALPRAVVDLLEVAAVIGREFDLATTAEAHRVAVPDVLELLDPAVAARVVLDAGHSADGYRFAHALVRETIYDRLPVSRRARLHAAVGEAIERVGRGTRMSEVAFHYEQATPLVLADRAVDAALAASAQARQMLALQEAEEHLRGALRVLSRVRDPGGRELEVQARLASLLLMTQGYSARDLGVAAARVRELALRTPDVPEVAGVLWALWSYRCVRADFAGALEIAEELVDRSRVASQDAALAAGLQARGTTLWHLGRLEDSAAALESALDRLEGLDADELERAGLTHVPILARCHTSHPFFLLDRGDEAERQVALARAAASRERDPFNHAISALFTGWLAGLRGDYVNAVRRLDDSVRTADEHGFRQLAAIGSAPLGWARAMKGDPGVGIPTLEAGIAAMDATGARMLRHWHLGLLADAHRAAGREDDALAAVEQALLASEATGEAFHRPELLRLRGLLLLGRGARAEALASLEDAVASARRQGSVVHLHRAGEALSAVCREGAAGSGSPVGAPSI